MLRFVFLLSANHRYAVFGLKFQVSTYYMFAKKNNHGFSLVELMVVIVIVGILAIGVVMSFTNPIAKVKAVAFEMRGDFNLARAVAVRENKDVLINFILGAVDGYKICFDTTGTSGLCDGTDEIIKEVTFREEVQFYDFADGTAFPADGPTKTPPYATELAGKALAGQDGITFTGNAIEMYGNGTSDQDGAVIVYFPANSSTVAGRRTIRGKPYATVIEGASTGKVKLARWRPEIADDAGTPYDDRWSRK